MTNYISRAEADELCDEMINEFLDSKDTVINCIDIDGFVKDFLKCNVIYESFAEEDKDCIGFTGNGKRPLCIKKEGNAVSVVYSENTIILDKYLNEKSEQVHRRFVLAHEAGHVIANRINPDSPACFHRFTDNERVVYSIDEMRERYSICEWQANTIAEALLMPRFLMIEVLKRFNGGRRIPVYGESIFHPREKTILKKMADSLQVTHTALVKCLRNLGMLSRHDVSEYIKKELRLGDGS